MTVQRNIPVLVVEDNLEMRSTIKMCLEECGFTSVFEADSGAAAKVHLSTRDIGLIICDWMMPEMTGLDLLRHVRESARNRAVPFVMVTGAADKGKVADAMKLGISGFLVKPFPIGVFLEAIEKAAKSDQARAHQASLRH